MKVGDKVQFKKKNIEAYQFNVNVKLDMEIKEIVDNVVICKGRSPYGSPVKVTVNKDHLKKVKG